MKNRVKQCADCGDDIPYYTRVCPFCHYDVHYSTFDVNSSPYLMMRDLKSLCIELSRIQAVGGAVKSLFRLFTFRPIDPERERVLSIEVTFDVIHEQVLNSFGRERMVLDSLVVFEEMILSMLVQRATDVARLRAIRRGVILSLCAVGMLCGAAYALLYLSPVQ